MKKYVAVDLLKEKLDSLIDESSPYTSYVSGYRDCLTDLRDGIRNIPITDVIKIIHCKDCKYLRIDQEFQSGRYCAIRNVNGGGFCKDNDFCSYGEQKRERLRMIGKDIELILNKYLTDDECYMPYRYETDEEGKEQEIHFETELREYCEKYDVNYKYVVQEAFDSCGYSCDVGVIAFIDENFELQVMTVLYERY